MLTSLPSPQKPIELAWKSFRASIGDGSFSVIKWGKHIMAAPTAPMNKHIPKIRVCEILPPIYAMGITHNNPPMSLEGGMIPISLALSPNLVSMEVRDTFTNPLIIAPWKNPAVDITMRKHQGLFRHWSHLGRKENHPQEVVTFSTEVSDILSDSHSTTVRWEVFSSWKNSVSSL